MGDCLVIVSTRPCLMLAQVETAHAFWHKLLHMFSRNSQPPSSSNAPPWQVFQEDVEDLLAENLVSAQRTAKLLDKATKAGIPNINRRIRKTVGKTKPRIISDSSSSGPNGLTTTGSVAGSGTGKLARSSPLRFQSTCHWKSWRRCGIWAMLKPCCQRLT